MSDPSPRLFGDVLQELGLVTATQLAEALSLQSLSGQRVGEALVSLGYVTRNQLRDALMEALGLSQVDVLERPRIGEILVGLKYITAPQLNEALLRQRQDGRRVGEILVELQACSYKALYEALGIQSQRAPRAEPATAASASGGAVRVVVVDDSPIACALVSQGLTELGFEVHAYQDPYEALEQVSRIQPAIVLSDLEMPGIDGAELCRRLKNGPSRAVPVIILTANDEDTQRVGGLRAGADDYVNKGASLEELAARIDSILRRTGETERVRKLFARYTSDAVVDEILRAGDVVLTGEKREVTVLFADLRNFTRLSGLLPPEEVVAILNAVLGMLSNAVLTFGGTLDKFLGDGLMAIFGAPVSREDDAFRALQAAQMMMAGLEELQRDSQRQVDDGARDGPVPELRLGIGINTGLVVAGNLGSSLRVEYTVIGDPVNMASRLCSIAGPGETLVGERTRELITHSFGFVALPPALVKGKTRPIPLYRVVTEP